MIIKMQNSTVDVDNSEKLIAESVSDGLKYQFSRYILVKEMEPKKVTRTIQKAVPNGEKGEDGVELTDLVEEAVEVDSMLREGIIIKLPLSITSLSDEERKESLLDYKIGDRVVYRNMRSTEFDYLAGSAMIEPFDIICVAVD